MAAQPPFKAKYGKPYWHFIRDYLVTLINSGQLDVGGKVSDATLRSILPFAIDDGSLSQATWRAVRDIRESHKRDFKRVRGVGYEMVAGMLQVKRAHVQRVRGARRVEDGEQIIANVDHTLLSRSQQKHVRDLQLHYEKLSRDVRSLNARVDKVDNRVGLVEKDSVSLQQQVDRLATLMALHFPEDVTDS